MEETSAVDDFISWLAGIYDASLTTTFEIGSLAFFRSSAHEAMMKDLDKQGEELEMEVAVDFSPIEDIPVRTLSASMLLPKQSVNNFRKEIRRRTSAPRPTSMPRARFERSVHGFESRKLSRRETIGPHREGLWRAMKEQFALWDTISRDLCRQGMGPALMSGNTVVDERNFAMM